MWLQDSKEVRDLNHAPSLEAPSSPGRAFGCGRRFIFIGKLTNYANTGAERIEKGVSPSGRHDRRRLLIYEFVRLSEKTRELAFRRSGEFSYRHEEFDVAILLIFLNREMMQQG